MSGCPVMNKRIQTLKYILSDFLSATLSWNVAAFHFKQYLASYSRNEGISASPENVYFYGLFLVPVFWILLYFLSGYYKEVYRKSRLSELLQTIGITFIGVVILFLILDERLNLFLYNDSLYLVYFLSHFLITYLPRFTITSYTARRIRRGDIGFNTLIIGSNAKAVDTYLEIKDQAKRSGNRFVGFIDVDGKTKNLLAGYMKHLGNIDNIRNIISEHQTEEVIIAIESSEHHLINRIINKLIESDVVIKAIPSIHDILTGKVKMNSILGMPLILVSHQLMPAWQENVKNILDFTIALLALLITLPLTLFLIAGIRISSPGPVFYSHERIGRYGKPFTIYKFRSMHMGAEKNGPELSSKNDGRITKFGKFMRRTRFDEIPNFYNVLKGEMSLVGPRPERKYFIDKIVEKEPHYLHLLKVKPGITSWGQVQYGYAENVEQMVARLKYDLIYLDNMSIYVDLKIIIYTILTILKRKGI
ncbi:MAG: sugar transferase [Bacteroidales bacterium]|nr:sugar transferase [Bacteroidales bacterium]